MSIVNITCSIRPLCRIVRKVPIVRSKSRVPASKNPTESLCASGLRGTQCQKLIQIVTTIECAGKKKRVKR